MRSRSGILVLLIALLLAACGGAEDASEGEDTTTTAAPTATTEAPPETTTTQAVETTTTTEEPASAGDGSDLLASLSESPVTSARIEGQIEIQGASVEGEPMDATIAFSSAFDNNTGDSSFLMDMSALAATMPTDPDDPFGDVADLLGEMEVRTIGDTVYMKFPFFTLLLGAETDWISMPADGSEDFTAEFSMAPGDPNEIFDAYGDAPSTVEELGSENVNGVDTTHYRITFDVDQMEMTDEEREELEASGLFADGQLPMDLWVSEEGYPVRMLLQIDGTQVDAPPEEQFELMTMQYDLFDINQPITIEPPPEEDVTDVEGLDSAFGFPSG